MAKTVHIYPLDNYKIGRKDDPSEKDSSVQARLTRMEAQFEREGMRRTVEGVLLIHQHKHPHVLLLQMQGGSFFKLPGGRLRPGENEIEGLKRKLSSKMAPPGMEEPAWEVGELLSMWWRPNFEQHQYPYQPVHVTRPKECKKIFLVHLPEHCTFAISQKYKLVAVPLYELYENQARYGTALASIPLLLARLQPVCV